jgi:hypothetical protein
MRYNRVMSRPRGARRAGAALVAAALLGVGGCSSSGSSSPSSATPSGTPADPATTKAIAHAYAAFFDPKASLAVAERYLQHGAELKTALIAQSHNPQAHGLSARVTKVTLLSPNSAAVRFDLLSGGKSLLSDNPGNAAREGGQWKVAAKTFCDLVGLTGHPPAACSDPKITDLPN